jgi:hypothetical protein
MFSFYNEKGTGKKQRNTRKHLLSVIFLLIFSASYLPIFLLYPWPPEVSTFLKG